MDVYLVVKTLHILSATVLFGTGLGIAFFMVRSRFTGDLQEKFYAARTTVLADYLFTAPAAVLQPMTGFWLISHSGFRWDEPWLVATYALYVIAGVCWLPVVFIQIRLRDLVADGISAGTFQAEDYARLFRIWIALGIPAFAALVAVFFLMVTKYT